MKNAIIILAIAVVLFYIYADHWKKKAKALALNVADRVDVNEGTGVVTVFNSLDTALITMTPKEDPHVDAPQEVNPKITSQK